MGVCEIKQRISQSDRGFIYWRAVNSTAIIGHINGQRKQQLPRTKDDHAVRAGQRDAETARLRGEQKAIDRRVRVEL